MTARNEVRFAGKTAWFQTDFLEQEELTLAQMLITLASINQSVLILKRLWNRFNFSYILVHFSTECATRVEFDACHNFVRETYLNLRESFNVL